VKIDQTTIKLLISGLDELEASDSEKAIAWCTSIPELRRDNEVNCVNLRAGEIAFEYENYYRKIAELKAGLWSVLHTVRQDEAIKHLMEDIDE